MCAAVSLRAVVFNAVVVEVEVWFFLVRGIIVLEISGAVITASDATAIRYPSTRACRDAASSSARGIAVCKGDRSDTVRTDVSRFPSASGSMMVTKRTGGPPMGSIWVDTGSDGEIDGGDLTGVGGGTVSMPGIWLMLSWLAVFSTSLPELEEKKDAALLG